MKTLNLKIQGGLELNPLVEIDGKVVDCKKNKDGTIEIKHQTENESANISIKNVLEINGRCWWLVQMLYYIVSLFGILNPRLPKVCYNVEYQAKVNLIDGDNNLTLKFCHLKKNGKAIEADGGLNIEETINESSIDEKAKKRRKWLLISQLIGWFLLVIAISLTLFFVFKK